MATGLIPLRPEMSAKLLSLHFKHTYDGGYRYLDRCGEFMIRAEQLSFLPGEAKPTGAKMDIPEQGISLAVDTASLVVTQDFNPDETSFQGICERLSTLCRELFQPVSIARTGFAFKFRRDYKALSEMEKALRAQVDREQRDIGLKLGMIPQFQTVDYWFSSGSRNLHVTLQPLTLRRTGQQLRPTLHDTSVERRRYERQQTFLTRFPDDLHHAIVLEVDLMEDNPPENANLKEHFAEARRMADILIDRFLPTSLL